MRTLLLACLVVLLVCATTVLADGPADNVAANVRRLPKLGIEVPAEQRAELEAGLAKLQLAIEQLQTKAQKDAQTALLLPDVQIYYKAVHDALAYQEFHAEKELDEAVQQLAAGQTRGEQLLRGEAPWTTQTGLVPRGYVSKIDGSVQPYGMVVPETYTNQTPVGYRCDVWLHGRGETNTELNFIRDRTHNPGTFTPSRALVLHPYGRWNNAFKLAGEVDVFEALADAQAKYAIDDDRIAIRGFSMGGAGVWHLAVHYPDRWFAANPGAGFSETPEFLKLFQQEELKPTWWEERLWGLYDCPHWAINLSGLPTVAYSGEIDRQKQAADVMQRALAVYGRELVHVIGPNTAHAYHPAARREVDERLAVIDKAGKPRVPHSVHFVTRTLRYNQNLWITIDELTAHWNNDATLFAELGSDFEKIDIKTSGVEGFTIHFQPGQWRKNEIGGQHLFIAIDDEFEGLDFFPYPKSDLSVTTSYHFADGKWKSGQRPADGLRKKHGLQGPIDDAFMDSFLMVRPSGQAAHEAVEKWTTSECDRAIEHWRRHFRGAARVKQDVEVTAEDIQNHHLILWGDPQSNAILAKIADKLPLQWTKGQIAVPKYGAFGAETHALIAIYPNPLNPEKYVVLNSGFTFRDYAHLNNARQVPMLPDWAVVDLTTPPGNIWPGKIVAADFFDERWQVKKSE
jgi:pimeloyl-ACP methyl ester carboxylesterase